VFNHPCIKIQNILMLFWINYGHSSLVEVDSVANAISIRLSYILMRINKIQMGLIRTSIMNSKQNFTIKTMK
jgi:hypothetical protein